MGPTIGELLDARLRVDAEALDRITERLITIASMVASQAIEVADCKRAVVHLQRRAGRWP